MKRFKVADFWMSVLLIGGFVIFGLITRDQRFCYGYFIVGGWQVISMAVHWYNRWFTRENQRRKFYHRFVLMLSIGILLVSGASQLSDYFFVPILLFLYLMLFIAPLMAVFYAGICYEETFNRMKRPMELLK